MELFPDGGFVRLESRESGKFVHADEDWQRVSLRPNGAVPSLNAVWQVEHYTSEGFEGGTFVLLQNAAYGRYLSVTIQQAPFFQGGYLVTQVDRDEPSPFTEHEWPCMWRVERLPPPDQDYVRLRYRARHLRANDSHFACIDGVTVDGAITFPRLSTMMHWTVHEVAASPVGTVPQPLPLTPTQDQEGCLSGLLFWRGNSGLNMHPDPPRKIRHVRADDDGDFDDNYYSWESFGFNDNSLINLKYKLGPLQEDWNEDLSAFTLCILPGSHARLMPLVTDLPRSLDPINIVVLRTGSPAAEELVYPEGPAP